jgi:hypothetical protein
MKQTSETGYDINIGNPIMVLFKKHPGLAQNAH